MRQPHPNEFILVAKSVGLATVIVGTPIALLLLIFVFR